MPASSPSTSRQQPFCGDLCSTPRHLWLYATACLLLYGFFKEFKPSEAFLTPYLRSATDGKNFTSDEVNDLIYPVWTYSYLVAAIFVFLFTDLIRYNPIIIIETLSYVATRILLIWGTSVFSQQMMQVAYGIATATEVGYFSYIYTAVPFAYYEKITGPVRAAVLFGRSFGAFAGQIAYSNGLLDYYGLNYFSLASVCLSGLFAIGLPWYFQCPCKKPQRTLYVNFSTNSEETAPPDTPPSFLQSSLNKLKDFKKFYTKPTLIRWSLWWAFGMCGMLQVGNYVQSLWKHINEENGDTEAVNKRYELNGGVEGATDLFAALAAIIASFLKINWPVWGEITMGGLSLIATIVLFISSYSHIVYVAYACHVIYRSTFAFVITIASSQIAIHIDYESYGLIFGFNTLIALVLQTVLTAIVNSWLKLYVRTQFVIYGCYYYALTIVFIFAGVYKISKTGCIDSFKQCWLTSTRQRLNSVRDNVVHYVSDNTSSETSSSSGDDEVEPDRITQSLQPVA